MICWQFARLIHRELGPEEREQITMIAATRICITIEVGPGTAILGGAW